MLHKIVKKALNLSMLWCYKKKKVRNLSNNYKIIFYFLRNHKKMGPALKFLRFSSGPNAEKDLSILDRAVESARSNEIKVEIIKEANEIKKLLSSKAPQTQAIYVCFPFEGQVFEKLKENGFRIIGPQCVISCLMLEIPVPKYPYPVGNVAMIGVVICCSSMKKTERNELHNLIQLMGGEVSADFTSVITHLIAKEVGSKKYQVATNTGIPVISPSWVRSIWQKSNYDHIAATSEMMIKDHVLPIFKGCTICVTGLDTHQREVIKSLTTEHGAVYSGELNMKTCTHLLVENPTGTKYNYARQWKLHCVLPGWFFDCIKEGHWLSEEPYKVVPENETSHGPGNMTSRCEIQDTLQNNSTLHNVSSLKHTLSSTALRAAEVAAKSKETRSGKKTLSNNNECENEHFKLVFKPVKSQSISLHDMTVQDCDNYYLDGCDIFLAKQAGKIFDMCKKFVNTGGGVRQNDLSETVTHIVLWESIPDEVKTFLLELDGSLPHVVSPLWLIDSFKNGEMMDEKSITFLFLYLLVFTPSCF